MKIYSKFRDYYDSVQIHGQDDTVHYIRNTEQIEFPKNLQDKLFNDTRKISLYHLDDKKASVELRSFIILFCGKIFRGFKLVEYNRTDDTTVDLGKYFYDIESTLKFYEESVADRKNLWKYWSDLTHTKVINNWLSKKNTDELETYAIENKIAIACFSDNIALKNPCLSNYEFFRLVEPYSAYQELDMFISGILSKDPNMMVEISDKDRIDQHGFNEWSFRKLPTKHK